MNLSLLTNKQMEMRTDKFMIYVFSAIMLGGMVACSSDDPETHSIMRDRFASAFDNRHFLAVGFMTRNRFIDRPFIQPR